MKQRFLKVSDHELCKHHMTEGRRGNEKEKEKEKEKKKEKEKEGYIGIGWRKG